MTIDIIGGDNIKGYAFVRQQGAKDCGVACMLMILKHYHGFASLEYLREITETTLEGVSLYNLASGFKKLGFSSYGIKGEVEELNPKILPVIAHGTIKKKYKHYVVVYKVDSKRKKVVIADPMDKVKEISFQSFREFSSGYFCVVEMNRPIVRFQKPKSYLTFLFQILSKNKKIFSLSLLFSFILLFIQILSCYHLQILLDNSISVFSIKNLFILSFFFLFLQILKEVTIFIKNKLLFYLSFDLEEAYTIQTFHHILSLPYFYYKNHSKGEMLSRIQEIKQIIENVSKALLDLIFNLCVVIGIFLLFFFFDFTFLFVFFFLMLLYACFFLFYRISVYSSKKEVQNDLGILNQNIIETYEMLPTIKNLNLLSLFKKRFSLQYKSFLNKQMHLLEQYNIFNTIFSVLESFGSNFYLFLVAVFIIKKEKGIGFLFTYQQFFIYLFSSYKEFLFAIFSLKTCKINYERITEVFTIEEEKRGKEKLNSCEEICIKHLHFRYGRRKILTDISLQIKKGEKILLYGKSGSGKSTLIKILMGLIAVKRNCVFLGDKDLEDINYLDLRENICYLSQNEILLTDTVYNNVTLYRNITYEEFLKVCRISLLDEILESRSLSYDFLLEENGFNLSGGERQRILLARTLLKKANIYIFDESLSEVDSKKERIILKRIFQVYKDKTILYVSHRFENEDLFDRKIKVENGVCHEG